mgnify:CR=1 FL=1
MYEEKIPFKRLGTVEEGYGQERQAAGKQIQILNTGNQTVTVKAVSAEGYVVGIPEKNELAPGETTGITVAPQKGLSPADYTAVLTVSTDHDTQAQTELKFVVMGDTNPPDGRMVGYAKITDKAGNTAMANVQVYVQKVTQPPVFIGISDGGSYCENVKFTVEDDNL